MPNNIPRTMRTETLFITPNGKFKLFRETDISEATYTVVDKKIRTLGFFEISQVVLIVTRQALHH